MTTREALVTGAAAGAVATIPMTGVMAIGRVAGALEPMPPEEMTDRAVWRITRRTAGRRGTDALATVAHLGFGATAGAVFALSTARWSSPRVPAAVAYAIAVWLLSYFGWAPALRLVPGPRTDTSRHPVMFAAHVVYGFVLGGLLDRANGPAPRINEVRARAAAAARSSRQAVTPH